jgi:hypothetical protein
MIRWNNIMFGTPGWFVLHVVAIGLMLWLGHVVIFR